MNGYRCLACSTEQSADFAGFVCPACGGNLDITYDYYRLEHSISNSTEAVFTGSDGTGTLPYWSPGSYWNHLLSAEYKLELWQTGKFQSGTSYFTVRYGVGYETGDNLLQEFEMNILLEISKIFLIKGTFDSQWSSEYDRLDGFISLSYRW